MDKKDYLDLLSHCVRCGSCKAPCPTYDNEPSEGMGARGRLVLLRSLLAGDLQPSYVLNDRIFSCILCRACSGACPLGIDIPEAIYHGRVVLRESDKTRRIMRLCAKTVSKWPDMSFQIIKSSRGLLLPLAARKGYIPFVPDFPDNTFRNVGQVHRVRKKRGRVAVFTGCSINYLFPFLGDSLINVLNHIGYEVILPKGEVCCGSPLRGLGMEEEAIVHAEKNLSIFGKLNVEAILSLCPTCSLTIKSEYPKLIGRGLENAMDISSFFIDKLGIADPIGKSAVYHDPCHLSHGLGIRKEPRELIKKAGFELLDSGVSGCCGFGGVFCFTNQEISRKLLVKSTEKLLATGAEAIVTSCPGCMLQFSRKKTGLPVLHLIELLEEAFCPRHDEPPDITDSAESVQETKRKAQK
jgi:glycolate oxidase iron-sulfur subunit